MGDDDRRDDFPAALNTEYFVLQGLYSGTINEASSRSTLYLLTLSSSLVSVGFVLGLSPDVFIPFVTAALFTVFLIGWFSIVRLIETSVTSTRVLERIAHIRRFYATYSPDSPDFFDTSGDDATDARMILGVGRSNEHTGPPKGNRTAVLGTMASMIGAVNGVVGGSGIGTVVGWLTQSTTIAIVTAIPVAVVVFAVVVLLQVRRFSAEFG